MCRLSIYKLRRGIINIMNGHGETTKIYIEKYLKDFGKQSTVYNAVVEAITNSIDAIEARRKNDNRFDGEIHIYITRNNQLNLGDGTCPDIDKIEISDNGIGFTEENRNSFNTLYSPQKQNNGGKGLGRMFYIKYFREVTVESTFSDKGSLKSRFFRFGRKYDIVEDERIEISDGNMPVGSKITLLGYCGPIKHFNDSTESFAHRILEKILNYFVVDNFVCPRIVVHDDEHEIVLNDQIGDGAESKISLVDTGFVNVQNTKDKENFGFKAFKLRKVYSQVSRIMLTANNKVVTEAKLEDYIPEFAEDFEEEIDGRQQKYVLRYYVYGEYLDKNVNNERTDFYFDNSPNLEFPIGKKDIEESIALEAKKKMQNTIVTRFQNKKKAFKDYAERNIWYRNYLDKVNFESIKINPSEEEIEAELHKVKYEVDSNRRDQAENILNKLDIKGENLVQKMSDLSKELNETDESNLIQYMIFRKAALKLFEKAMQWNDLEKYEKEKLLHDIIFPTRKDSEEIPNEQHNLWLIDESLNFTQYLSSDKKRFTESDDRPDIAAFHYPVSYRDGESSSCPITIFEFKRPGRTDFIGQSDEEDPVEQIVRYVLQFKDGKLKQPNGFDINVSQTTPFYGYIIASANNDVKKWLVYEKNMTVMPDGEGWFLDRDKINLRIEFVTWEKLLKDAKIRHKVFFDKLGLKV